MWRKDHTAAMRHAANTDDRPCPQCDGVPVDSVAKPCGGTSTRNEASTLKPAVANRKRARSTYPVFQSTRGAFCSRDLMPTQGAGSGRSKFPRTPAYRECAAPERGGLIDSAPSDCLGESASRARNGSVGDAQATDSRRVRPDPLPCCAPRRSLEAPTRARVHP